MQPFRYLTLAIAGALIVTAGARSAGNDGSLTLYLDPLPPEVAASGLVLRLEKPLVVREDGTTVELDLLIETLSAGETTRTRLLATGNLPPGPYVGIRLRAASARLRGPEGETTLQLAVETPLTPFEFVASPDRPGLASLSLRHEPVREDAEYSASFVAVRPTRPSVEALGAVSIPGADRVAIFDRLTGNVVDLIGTARDPVGLAIDPLTRRAYVGCAGEDVVQAIDLADGKVLVSRRLRVGDSPLAVAVTPDGRTVLVANAGSGTVALFDAPTLSERVRVKVGNRPSYLIVDPEGTRAFVFDEMADAISVLDLNSAAVTAAAVSEGGPFRGALDDSGEHLYVIHRTSPFLRAIDTETLETSGEVYIGPDATAVTVDRRRDKIHVGLIDPPRVEVFDAFSLLASDSFETPGAVSTLTPDERENNVCLAYSSDNVLRIVKFVGQGDVAVIELPGTPAEIAFVSGK